MKILIEMKHTTIAILAFAIAALLHSSAFASVHGGKDPKKGYKFTLTIANNHDTVMYLGNYYAGKTFAIDTAYINKKGSFVFENKQRTLPPGLYFFTNPEGNYVEFMVYHEELDFTFSTSESNWTQNMKVKGSVENEHFYRFHRANYSTHRAIDSAYKAMGNGPEYKAFVNKSMVTLDSIKEAMIAARPQSMLALMMTSTRPMDVPTVDSNGNKMSEQERWEYMMYHFFDYMKLDDDAMVRTPARIFRQRVDYYIDTCLHNAPPETVCKYVDMLIDKSKPAKENMRYLVETLAEKYLQSNIMSYDAVYVHIVKRYIETGECTWMSPSTVDYNVKRANTWDKLLIGRDAPELIMKDDKGQWHSLHSLNHKYTLLVFWSPTCGHCKTMIPELYTKFQQYKGKYDICAYAVLSEPDAETRPKWHEFIEKHHLDWLNIDGGEANIDWHEVYDVITTPQIYLLDKDKIILAKRLNADSFEMVIKAIEENN